MSDMSTSTAFAHFRFTHRIPCRHHVSSSTQITPKPAVSTALFRRNPLSVLLVKRGKPPNKHLWALPGGSLNAHESLIHGAHRELREETSIPSHQAHLLPHPIQQVLVPAHKPVYCISVFAGVYTGQLPPVPADDAADACFCKIEIISDLSTVPNLETTINTALKHIQNVDFSP